MENGSIGFENVRKARPVSATTALHYDGSIFSEIPLRLSQSMDFKTPLAHISVSITFHPNSDNELRLFAVNTLAPIDVTIFRQITAPAKRISIITTLISTSLCR